MSSRLTRGLFSSNTDQWATPQDFFDKLNAEFHFTLDPCASPENAKCQKYYTKEQDGLIQDWGGGDCVLQSSIRESHQGLGSQMSRGIQKAGHKGGDAYSRENGHHIFPRLHLRASHATLYPWASQIWRRKAIGSISLNDCRLLTAAI